MLDFNYGTALNMNLQNAGTYPCALLRSGILFLMLALCAPLKAQVDVTKTAVLLAQSGEELTYELEFQCSNVIFCGCEGAFIIDNLPSGVTPVTPIPSIAINCLDGSSYSALDINDAGRLNHHGVYSVALI